MPSSDEERDILIWQGREIEIVIIQRCPDGTVIVEIDDPLAGEHNGSRLSLVPRSPDAIQ